MPDRNTDRKQSIAALPLDPRGSASLKEHREVDIKIGAGTDIGERRGESTKTEDSSTAHDPWHHTGLLTGRARQWCRDESLEHASVLSGRGRKEEDSLTPVNSEAAGCEVDELSVSELRSSHRTNGCEGTHICESAQLDIVRVPSLRGNTIGDETKSAASVEDVSIIWHKSVEDSFYLTTVQNLQNAGGVYSGNDETDEDEGVRGLVVQDEREGVHDDEDGRETCCSQGHA